VAESVWQALNEAAFERGLPVPDPSAESVTIAAWPQLPAEWRDADMERRIARMQELVRAVRELRNRYTIDPRTPLDLRVRCDEAVAGDFRQLGRFLALLAGVGNFECGPAVTKAPQSATHVQPDFEAYVSLRGLIDRAAERARLKKQRAEIQKHLQAAQAKLANENFVKKAPPEVVQQQRDAVADLEAQLRAIDDTLRELGQE
jgi:valyl-tRNA synthetase